MLLLVVVIFSLWVFASVERLAGKIVSETTCNVSSAVFMLNTVLLCSTKLCPVKTRDSIVAVFCVL